MTALVDVQSDDQLMHLQWKDRTTGTIEDDLIIFPDDVEFKPVPACTTGRVFVLKFKTSNKRMFFWMQEPKADKDEEYCKKVNDNLNNPPAPGSARSGGGSGLASGLPAGLDFNNLGDSELQNLLNNMSQQQLMQVCFLPDSKPLESFDSTIIVLAVRRQSWRREHVWLGLSSWRSRCWQIKASSRNRSNQTNSTGRWWKQYTCSSCYSNYCSCSCSCTWRSRTVF